PPSPDYTLATPYTDDESEPYETFDTMVTSSPSPTPSYCVDSRAYTAHPFSRLFNQANRGDGTSELIVDTETKSTNSKDEITESEDEETAPEVKQQQAILAKDTSKDDPFGLGYKEARCRALECARDTVPGSYKVRHSFRSTPDQQLKTVVRTPTSPEWFLESLPVSPANPLSVASLVPVAALDEGDLLEIGAQLKLYGSILHTQAVRKEIYSQCFRLKSLERVQEETGITIGCILSWIAFCLGLRFALEDCVLSSEDLVFCLLKILRFIFKRSYVLSSRILRFALEALRFT
nr:hypothetical protein [Tanacetum cinerariifolium]